AVPDVEPVGADAEGHRRIEGVGGGKGRPRQPWAAETVRSLLENLAEARNVPPQSLGYRLRGHAHADVHRAVVAQGPEAPVHFGDDALCEGARCTVFRPHPPMPFRQVKGDAERIPHRALAVDQHGHLPGGGEGAQALVVVGLLECDHAVFKRDTERFHQHPRPQRPARIVPVSGDQRIAHDVSLRRGASAQPTVAPIECCRAITGRPYAGDAGWGSLSYFAVVLAATSSALTPGANSLSLKGLS